MRNWWKQPKILGLSAYCALKLLVSTMQVKINRHPEIDASTGYLFAFWHGKQFLPAPVLTKLHNTHKCAMVSPSRDGAILTVLLNKLGYDVIRGSSRDSGAKALLSMRRKLEINSSIGFAVDGPIGPIYSVKPGVVFMAQKYKIKIIPVGSAFSKYWTFKRAWDKFQVPKPFCKAGLVLGEPIEVPDGVDIKQFCLQLGEILQSTEKQAADLFK